VKLNNIRDAHHFANRQPPDCFAWIHDPQREPTPKTDWIIEHLPIGAIVLCAAGAACLIVAAFWK
jgi:hypothetical protein